jgi:DNA polymerase phi
LNLRQQKMARRPAKYISPITPGNSQSIDDH